MDCDVQHWYSPELRVCALCHQAKPVEQFCQSAHSRTWCRDCKRAWDTKDRMRRGIVPRVKTWSHP